VIPELSTPRDAAQAVNELAGIPGAGAHEEALTRLITTGARGGWSSLTQADFDQAQDAFDDAVGRPRRKRQNPILWKIGFWWHWHVTSPIVFPAMEAFAAFWWFAARQWFPGAIRVAVAQGPTRALIEDVSRFGAIRRRRWARRRAQPVRRSHPHRFGTHELIVIDLAGATLADYAAAFPNARHEGF